MKNPSQKQIKKDRSQARAWMVINKIRPIDIKRALELKYQTQVGETLSGIRDDKRVLEYLIDRGCPEKYLELPAKMKRAA